MSGFWNMATEAAKEARRLAADYDPAEYDIGEARAAVERMEKFLLAVGAILGEPPT